MRRMKFLAIIAMIVAVMLVFAGCGCQDKTGNDQNNNTSNQNTSSNTGKSDDSKSDTKTSNSDFEPTISLEQRKAVKAEDFINGKNFDLDGYAKALGYTRLEDPKGAIVYGIKKDGIKCLFTFSDGEIIAWFDYGDGYAYQTDPVGIGKESNGYTIDNGAKEGQQMVNKSGLDSITSVMSYLSVSNTIELDNLPAFYAVYKVNGSPSYYPNGTVQHIGKDVVETIIRK